MRCYTERVGGCGLITAYYRMETLELFAKISLNAHILGGAK